MANPGLGFRTVYSVLMEMSRHLLQPLAISTLLTSVTPGQRAVFTSNVSNMFTGAGVVIEPGTSNAELVIPSIINSIPPFGFTAIFVNSHAANVPIMGVTFPVQIATDPLLTVAEVLAYVSRAQNEFLARVPAYYLLTSTTVKAGQIVQTTDCSPISLERVALSSGANIPITSLTRLNGVVTAVTASPHNLIALEKFSVITPTDPTYAGAFKVATIISPTSFTYQQLGQANSSTTGGLVGILARLYAVTQEALSQLSPSWRSNSTNAPTSWFEDRVAAYQWGVDGIPSSNFPAELLLSIRDTDLLGQMDGFLVPDLVVHLVKYKALAYCWDKDGEIRDPRRAQFSHLRFDRGVMAAQRWTSQLINSPVSMLSQSRERRSKATA